MYAPGEGQSRCYIMSGDMDRLLGRAVQLEPMKPVLKAPGSMLLKLSYDGPLSNFASTFNLRQ